MNRDSNKYTIIFASAMVVVVALLLSFTHEVLKDTQTKNEDIDKMSQILRSIRIESSGDDAEVAFKNSIVDMYLVDIDGNVVPDSKEAAFAADMKVEMSKSESDRRYPVYVANIDGKDKYIMALNGVGLWGPLWGYIAVESDGSTIYGADFSHASETPGLGAEISHSWFSDEFIGKQLFKEGVFKSIAVVKKGQVKSDQDYVDGISGGTITGNGVSHMIFDSLEGYSKYLINLDSKK